MTMTMSMDKFPNQKNVVLGLSLPKELVIGIDSVRGDIGRSRYVTRLLEGALSAASASAAGRDNK
jgi:hypothetical protein